jgi:hypothetical protein
MNALLALVLLMGLYPLSRARAANHATTLTSTLLWAAAAQLGLALAATDPNSLTLAYLALCLSGCVGVAVLGARRPGVGAWNLVVGGLLAVFLLPIATGLGTPRLEMAHLLFLGATLAVGLLNYLPTRLGAAALLLTPGLVVAMARLAGVDVPANLSRIGYFSQALAPWAAWLILRQAGPRGEMNRMWLGFRDSYGFLWAQRVREQFNRSAVSAGLRTELGWSGLQPAGVDDEASLTILRALLKRFGTVQALAPSPEASDVSARLPNRDG